MLQRFVLSTALATALFAQAAISQTDTTTVTVANDRGGETTIDRTVTRDGTVVTGEGSAQTNAGRGGQRRFTRSFDPETGTFQRNAETVTNNGRASSSAASTQCDGAGNCTRTGSYTGPDGRTGSSVTETTIGEDGTVTSRTTTTRPNGEIAVRERQSVQTGSGRAGTVVTNGPEGQTVRDFQRGRTADGGFERRSAVTGPNGRTATADATVQCNGGSCRRQLRQQGPEGRTRLVENEGERTGPGEFQGRRRVIGPDGETRESRRWIRVDRERRRNRDR